jgi:hypothetical protein
MRTTDAKSLYEVAGSAADVQDTRSPDAQKLGDEGDGVLGKPAAKWTRIVLVLERHQQAQREPRGSSTEVLGGTLSVTLKELARARDSPSPARTFGVGPRTEPRRGHPIVVAGQSRKRG